MAWSWAVQQRGVNDVFPARFIPVPQRSCVNFISGGPSADCHTRGSGEDASLRKKARLDDDAVANVHNSRTCLCLRVAGVKFDGVFPSFHLA